MKPPRSKTLFDAARINLWAAIFYLAASIAMGAALVAAKLSENELWVFVFCSFAVTSLFMVLVHFREALDYAAKGSREERYEWEREPKIRL